MHLVMPVTFRARPDRDLRVEGSRVWGAATRAFNLVTLTGRRRQERAMCYRMGSLAHSPSVSLVRELTFDHDCISIHHRHQKRHSFAGKPFAESP